MSDLRPLEHGERGYYVDKGLAFAHNVNPVGGLLVVAALWALFGYLVGYLLSMWLVIPLFNGGSWNWDGDSNWGWIILVSGGVWPLGYLAAVGLRRLFTQADSGETA